MGKKWRKSIFQLLPLDGQYFLTVALNDWSLGKQLILFPENLHVSLGGCCDDVPLLDVMWVQSNQWERELWGKNFQLYNNKFCLN